MYVTAGLHNAHACCGRTRPPLPLPHPLSLSLLFSAPPDASVARRRNIVINNPFWLVFAGAPDRRSSPLPFRGNLLPQTPPAWRYSCTEAALFSRQDDHFDLRRCRSMSIFTNDSRSSPCLRITPAPSACFTAL